VRPGCSRSVQGDVLAAARIEFADFLPGFVDDDFPIRRFGDALHRPGVAFTAFRFPRLVGDLGDFPALEIHAEQVVMWAFVGHFVLPGGPVGKENNFVLAREKRIFGEIQVNVVAGGCQLANGATGFFILEGAYFRFPGLT
jgi:hypothetical protein